MDATFKLFGAIAIAIAMQHILGGTDSDAKVRQTFSQCHTMPRDETFNAYQIKLQANFSGALRRCEGGQVQFVFDEGFNS
jgi:hypothetical protein